jgi:hypothetical protein
LSPLVSGLVAELERTFDSISNKLSATATLESSWKENAFRTTLSELPKLSIVGTESGDYHGLGQYIYGEEAVKKTSV